MEQLGILKKEHREDGKKRHMNDLYTLYDYAEIWDVDSSNEDETSVADKIEVATMIAQLKQLGYTVIKDIENP